MSSAASGGIDLFWALSFSNATVDATGSLYPTPLWTSQSEVPTIQDGRYIVTLPATSNVSFFRLSLP